MAICSQHQRWTPPFGRLIDHKHRVILDWPQADLIDSGVAQNWADLACLSVSPERLRKLRASGKKQYFEGVEFERYDAIDTQVDAKQARLVWWNAERALPLKVVRGADGPWSQEIVKIQNKVDRQVLRDPETRFPNYQVMDMVDWREEHHESHGQAGLATRHAQHKH